VLLTWSPHDKRLVNAWAADHTTTIAGGQPILVLDMHEHAYHMDYGAKPPPVSMRSCRRSAGRMRMASTSATARG